MCRLLVATIHCRTAVSLRHHKLKDGLLGRPDLGLAIQEAVLEEQLPLGLNIGCDSFLIENCQESLFENFPGSSKVFHHLVEHRVVFLFNLPVYNISGSQSRCSGGNRLLLIGIPAFWIRANSQFSPLLKRGYGVVQYSFDSRIGNLIQIILDLFLWKALIQPT